MKAIVEKASRWDIPLKNLISRPQTDDRADSRRVRTSMIRSLGKIPDEKMMSYFHQTNVNHLNNALRIKFLQESGFVLDRQNDNDILAIMRKVYIDNGSQSIPYMNDVVLDIMMGQVRTGVAARVHYIKGLDKPLQVFDPPQNTSTVGLRSGTGRYNVGM